MAARNYGHYILLEHHATHFHFDFRLQQGSVMASWAIPKGPSMIAGINRLAIEVPDHPLGYFEGVIPAGRYGAGHVFLRDKGYYEVPLGTDPEVGLAQGKLVFRLHGSKLKGSFELRRMPAPKARRHWLLIKQEDGFSDPSWQLKPLMEPRPKPWSNFRQQFFKFDEQ